MTHSSLLLILNADGFFVTLGAASSLLLSDDESQQQAMVDPGVPRKDA